MIDVTDPVLAPIIASSPVRDECDLENCGWYPNGLIALVRMIMKDKITVMVGESDEANDEWTTVYERVIKAIPPTVDEETLDQTYEVDMDGLSTREKVKASELMTATRARAKQDDTFKNVKRKGCKRVSNASRLENSVHDKGEGDGQSGADNENDVKVAPDGIREDDDQPADYDFEEDDMDLADDDDDLEAANE